MKRRPVEIIDGEGEGEMGGTAAQNPRHLSLSVEHFTPRYIVDIAREALGGVIDLDPASSEHGNATVKARRFFSIENDGFIQPWSGAVFLNPPGGKSDGSSNQKRWWQKLVEEHVSGRVKEAVFLSFSIELLQTSQVGPRVNALETPPRLLTPHDYTVCFPSRRIAYLKEDGTIGGSPPHSSALIYLGPNYREFVRFTATLGRCMRPA
jgi:hypothetical protein